jgi:hypothetical protein
MLTNGTATQENYYRIKFQGLPYDVFEYGVTALDAVKVARTEAINAGIDTDTPLNLGNATARPAVYKEWNYGTEHYTNGGDFIRDTSKPCRECGTPVPFHTHREELGFCQPCQSAYFDGGND